MGGNDWVFILLNVEYEACYLVRRKYTFTQKKLNMNSIPYKRGTKTGGSTKLI